VKFLTEFGLDAENRRYHDKTTAPEPHLGFEGEGGACRHPWRTDHGGAIAAFDAHANQIKQWKEQLLEGATGVFGGEAKTEAASPTVDIKTLHAKIDELAPENVFLSGALGKAGLLGEKK